MHVGENIEINNAINTSIIPLVRKLAALVQIIFGGTLWSFYPTLAQISISVSISVCINLFKTYL